jgi:TupA-like ATPgrasp
VALQLVERTGAHRAKARWFTPRWEPIADQMQTYLPLDEEVKEVPHCLDEMLALASKLGAALGTYMRIDFFVGEDGCVFNEFSSLPLGGGYNTPYCDRFFGARWAERHPHAT